MTAVMGSCLVHKKSISSDNSWVYRILSCIFLFLCMMYLCAVRNMCPLEQVICQLDYGNTQMSNS